MDTHVMASVDVLDADQARLDGIHGRDDYDQSFVRVSRPGADVRLCLHGPLDGIAEAFVVMAYQLLGHLDDAGLARLHEAVCDLHAQLQVKRAHDAAERVPVPYVPADEADVTWFGAVGIVEVTS